MFTYVMGDISGNVKIGRSKNPEKRWEQLSTANPTLVMLLEKEEDEELFLHKLFEQQNVPSRGKEWFSLTEEQLFDLQVKRGFSLVNPEEYETFIMYMHKKGEPLI